MIEIKNGKICIDHSDVVNFGVKEFKRYFKFARMKGMLWEMTATYPNVGKVNELFHTNLIIEEPKDETNITQYLMDIDYQFKREPYKHQLDALAHCGNREHYAYFLEPGLGKTKIAIDDAMILYKKGKLDTVLVVCPISAMSVWENEIKKNTDCNCVSTWPSKPSNMDGMRFYIINHDALVSNFVNDMKHRKKLELATDELTKKNLEEKIEQIRNSMNSGIYVASSFLGSSTRCMMIIDESTCISNWQSLRTQFCTILGNMANYKRILTGDPIPNNPIDLYSQLYWLDPTIVKNRSYYAFRNHFCDMGGYKNKQIVGYKNMDELISICKRHGYRARTDDVLDMPQQNWMVRQINPDDETIKLYNKIIEEDIVTYLDQFDNESMVSVSLVLTQLIKLQQVCGGTLIDDSGVAHTVGKEKLNELMLMLDEWGNKKVLIWHQFREEGRMITDTLKKKKKSVALFNGDLSASERGAMVADFENGSIDYLVIQNDAGHLSITLNKATYAVWYSNHLRPIVRSQSERRNWRIGQGHRVMYYDLLMNGMIDSWIYKRLRRKRNFNATITDARMTKKEIMRALHDEDE